MSFMLLWSLQLLWSLSRILSSHVIPAYKTWYVWSPQIVSRNFPLKMTLLRAIAGVCVVVILDEGEDVGLVQMTDLVSGILVLVVNIVLTMLNLSMTSPSSSLTS